MNIELFGVLREAAGAERIRLELEPPRRIGEVLDALSDAHPALAPHLPRVACAVGEGMRSRSDSLEPGETLVLLPPVSGG